MTTMTDEQMAAARALESQATPGPWFSVDSPWGDGTSVNALSDDPHAGMFVCECEQIAATDEYEDDEIGLYRPEDNATFIAASRTLVPALLAHVDAQAAELTALRDVVRDLASLNLDAMGPLDALSTLYRLQRKAPPLTTVERRQERDRSHG